ncbi:MAG: cupin domain-containing protein, partial [Gammaproteobacteria bacterium]|nr:cupin domain-containing protein [Gammaproteobacteria bacterium]
MSNFIRLLPQGSAAGLQPSDMVDPSAFTTDDKTELNDTFFATGDENILTGVWECAPCREEIDSYPVHEMMSVISGSVTLTDPTGNSETFTVGD